MSEETYASISRWSDLIVLIVINIGVTQRLIVECVAMACYPYAKLCDLISPAAYLLIFHSLTFGRWLRRAESGCTASTGPLSGRSRPAPATGLCTSSSARSACRSTAARRSGAGSSLPEKSEELAGVFK